MPPGWLLRLLDPGTRRDAFEPAWHDVAAEHRERMRGARRGRRVLNRLWLRMRGWFLLLQCLSLQRRLSSVQQTSQRTGMMEGTARDFRFAARALQRRPGFTVLAAVTLALGIGANTAIFSVVRSVLLRSLPYADADRLVVIWGDNATAASTRDPHAPETVQDYMREVPAVETMAAITPQWSFTLVGDGAAAERVHGFYVSGTFLPMLGVQPVIGRVLNAEDDRSADAAPVAVIGYGLWQRRFGGAESVLGSELRTVGGSATIVGVLPASFRWREEAEVWIPVVYNSFWSTGGRRVRLYEIVGRLAPDATHERAQAEAARLSARLAAEYPENLEGIRARVVPLLDDVVGPVRRALLVLLGAAGLVLILACANVASLLLVRGDGRRREVAVRAALGGTRRRIARELIAESLLLGLAGGALGMLMALGGVRALLPFVPAGIPRREEIAIDGTVLLFTLALALATGLLFGLAPLLEAFRADAAATLREGGRGASPGRRRARAVLVVAEVAVAVMIAGGASLLLRSFGNLQRVDPGFQTERVVSMDLSNLPADATERITLMESIYDRLASTAGVLAAGEVSRIPLLGGNITSRLAIEDRPLPQEEQPEIDFRRASRGYFAAMSIPLLDGRMFEAGDDVTAAPVALINDVAAERFFPNEDPIGRAVSFGGGQYLTIIGIVGGVRHLGLADAPRPEAYVHTLQGSASNPQLLVRTSADPRAALPAVRTAIRDIAPAIVISRVTTMEEARALALAGPRFNTMLFGLFAALALLLAAIGAYGVMAYSVAQRRREIGVRLSVGARPRDVAAMIVRDGMKLALLGLAIGIAGALGASRALRGLLYGVSPTDGLALGAAAAIIAVAVMLACLLSARRATSVHPIEALRVE
jgi:predicted permease